MIRYNERLDGVGAEMMNPACFSRSFCSGLKAALSRDLGLCAPLSRSLIRQEGLSAALNFEHRTYSSGAEVESTPSAPFIMRELYGQKGDVGRERKQ